jgi:drug/metabolite transporter (DMT)-like permease
MHDKQGMTNNAKASVGHAIYPIAAVVIWAGNNVITKMAAGAIAPNAISFYRWLLALLVLTPFIGLATWRNRTAIRPYLLKIAVLSLFGMVLFQSLAYFAAATASATNIGMIVSLMPLLTLLFSSLLLRDPVTLGTLGGGLLSLFGLVWLVGQGQPARLFTHGVVAGEVMMLGAAIAYGLYNVLLRKWAIRLPIWQLLYVQIWFAVLMLLPGFLMTSSVAISVASVPLILYATIGASIAAPFLWMRGISHLGAGHAAMFVNLLPVFTILIAVPVLGETLHGYHVVGGGITLAGVLLAQMIKRPLCRPRNLA